MKLLTYQIGWFFFLSSTVTLMSCSGDHRDDVGKKDDVVMVTVVSAKTGGGNEGVQVSGQIASRHTAVISSRIMGYITAMHVKAGEKVEKGQLLATLSSGDIQAKEAQAHAMVIEAEAAMTDARNDYERFEALHKQESASAKEFENAALRYTSAKAKTETARQMQNEVRALLAYTVIRAPFAGVITQKNLDAGSMANPGVPILVLEDTGGYKVNVAVSENDILSISMGSQAEVTIKSSGRTLMGTVSEISPSSQYSGGQYIVGVTLPERESAGLYAGMTVNVTMASAGQGKETSVLVPTSSVVYKDQLTGLYVLGQNQTALLRWVRLGKTYGEDVEIISGLAEGEKFVLSSEGKLYNGALVKLKNPVAGN